MKGKKRLKTADMLLMTAISMFLACWFFAVPAYAVGDRNEVQGAVYTFEKNSHYEISEADSIATVQTDEFNTYGRFSLSGSITNISTKGDVPAYEVSENNLKLFYTYGNSLLTAEENSWHLIDDKSKEIDGTSLDASIMKGALLLQTSKDQKNWTNVACSTNVFSDIPIQTESFYSATDIQLNNGCFYRLIVVYETEIRDGSTKILFVKRDNYSYEKHAEVYEFYACNSAAAAVATDVEQKYSLGAKVRCDKFDGYSGEATIDKDDPHYGWDLGNFFVSGYTGTTSDQDGNMIFLKNVGDQVTLWFNLKESIDAIQGDKNVSVTADLEGYDQYFESERMDFGRGILIVRKTDSSNIQSEPTYYKNYLEANAAVGADTKVQLCEEGDYEVALDYQITKDQLIDKVGHYRIFFRFSVRNGNCMVYPFDIETGGELSTSSLTESGFRLDYANSKYLKVNLKREILAESADGLVEDTRFNALAKDGGEYTEEGIYTITVTNAYTNQTTTKKIYVGTNNILKAYMTTGLSISEINRLVADGATVSESGTIQISAQAETDTNKVQESEIRTENETSEALAEKEELAGNSFKWAYVGVVCIVLCIVIAIPIVIKNRKKQKAVLAAGRNDDKVRGA